MWKQIRRDSYRLKKGDILTRPSVNPRAIAKLVDEGITADFPVHGGLVVHGFSGYSIDQAEEELGCKINAWTWEDKPETASKRPKTPVEDRVSASGLKFPKSKDDDWDYYDGLGWIHRSEAGWFSYTFSQCGETNKWYKNGEMVETGYGYSVCKDVAAKYEKCDHTGKLFKPDDLLPARDSSNRQIKVGATVRESSFFEDALDHEYYPREVRVVLYPDEPNGERKTISRFTVSKSDKYGQCNHCGHVHNKGVLKPIDGTEGIFCPSCYATMMRRVAIREYNYKGYPKPIFTPIQRKITPRNAKMIEKYMKEHGLGPEGFTRLFGVELEMEFSRDQLMKAKEDRFSMALKIREALPDFVMIKEDGTLVSNGKYSDSGNLYAGIEVVSAPADLAEHRKRWAIFEQQPWHKYLRAWDTDTCGMHVHISKAALTPMIIGRVLYFVNLPANKRFIQKVAGRTEERFTKFYEKKISDSLHPENVINKDEENDYNRRRRVAVNIEPKNTIEFRIFRGTVRYAHIIRNIEFCDALMYFCYPCERSIQDLKEYKKFIEFVACNRKRWPELYRWFALHKMVPKHLLPRVQPYNPKDTRGQKPPEIVEPEQFPEVVSKPAKKAQTHPHPVLPSVFGYTISASSLSTTVVQTQSLSSSPMPVLEEEESDDNF